MSVVLHSIRKETETCVTLLDIVSKLFDQVLSGLVPLVFASIVVLQSHLGIVEGSSTQTTILVRVLQINLSDRGSCADCWVHKMLHTTLCGRFLVSIITIWSQT